MLDDLRTPGSMLKVSLCGVQVQLMLHSAVFKFNALLHVERMSLFLLTTGLHLKCLSLLDKSS